MPPLPPPLVRATLVWDAESDGGSVCLQLELVEELARLTLCVGEDETVAACVEVYEAVTPLDSCSTSANAQPPVGASETEAASLGQAQQAAAIAALQHQQAELLQKNQRLQFLVRQYLDGISKASRKSLQEVGAGAVDAAEQQTRYTLALQQLRRLMVQREAAAAAAAAALAPEQARLAAASAQALAQRGAFLRLVADTAAAANKAAAAGQLRAALPDRVLQNFLATEPVKAAEGRHLRAASARLAHRLATAERRLKEADLLSSEGLHLVDFEQMRIETAALMAKREARAAEVEKLRGKLVQAVQITAHVREKLHCAKQERAALEAGLRAAEEALVEARTEQTTAKGDRERLRRERGELAEDWRVVGDRRCLEDMREQRARLKALQAEAAALQAQYEAGERALCTTGRAC